MASKSAGKTGLALLAGTLLVLAAAVGDGAADSEGAPKIDSNAAKYLQRMSDHLTSFKEFSFDAEVTEDEIAVGFHKIQLTDQVEVVVRRPDKLWVSHTGDLYNKRLWYDGKTFSILTLADLFYATTKAPKGIDAALDEMADKYGVTTPVVDFLVDNPYENLMEGVKGAMYVGLHKVDGVPCHHLSFIEDGLDWQIWIEDGKRIVPRKFVVTYKQEPGSPQAVTVFKNWDFSTKHSDRLFEFKPPDSARKIEFLPLTQM
jgi:hypothetical protein